MEAAHSLPPQVVALIEKLFGAAQPFGPPRMHQSGRAVHIDGSLGYDTFITREGEVWMEEYEIGSEAPITVRSDRAAQILALAMASWRHPELAQLLPTRITESPSCPKCSGQGWHAVGNGRVVCHPCLGLGWLGAV